MARRFLFPSILLLASAIGALRSAAQQRQTGIGTISSGSYQIVNGRLVYSMQVEGSVAVMDQEGHHTLLHTGTTRAEVEKAANDAGVLIVPISRDEWRVGNTTIQFVNDVFTTFRETSGAGPAPNPIPVPQYTFADSLYRSVFQDVCAIHRATPGKEKVDTLVVFSNKEIISVSDFLLLYAKNNSSYRKEPLSEYLDLLINYKIKVFDEVRTGQDTTLALRNEMDKYALAAAKKRTEDDPSVTKDSLRRSIPAIRARAMEYRDGILLFNATDRNVWSKAVHDEAGRDRFYEENQSNYPGAKDTHMGSITVDYQKYLEHNWVLALMDLYKPVINERSFASLIKE